MAWAGTMFMGYGACELSHGYIDLSSVFGRFYQVTWPKKNGADKKTVYRLHIIVLGPVLRRVRLRYTMKLLLIIESYWGATLHRGAKIGVNIELQLSTYENL